MDDEDDRDGGDATVAERRQRLARRIQEQREDEVLELHTAPSTHYVDNAFSLVTANMAIVSLILGGVFMSRACEKPLAGFLVVLGLLAPCAACLPILIRQWFYLHLRLSNIVTISIIMLSLGYVAWLMVGQQWAFASSSSNCDSDLSTAANVVVFVLYLMLLLYAAKVVWYLVVRARYSYKQLCLSCFRDPYPNALQMSELELDSLELDVQSADTTDRTPVPLRPKRADKKQKLLMDLQRHQHELRQSLHRIFHSGKSHTKVTPRAKPARAAKVQGKRGSRLPRERDAADRPSHHE